MKFGKILPFVVGFLPVIALAAQNDPDLGYFASWFQQLLDIVNFYLIPGAIALGLLYFLFGLLKYIISKDDEARKEARGVMIHGIIALFVMVAVWGLVNLLGSITGVRPTSESPAIPSVEF